MQRIHSVVSDIEHGSIDKFETFDPEGIKAAIIKQLGKEHGDIITHEKTSFDKKYWGNDILNVYENNPKNGKPSLIIQKGSKVFYKAIN